MRTRDKVKHMWLALLFTLLPISGSYILTFLFFQNDFNTQDANSIQQSLNFIFSLLAYYNILTYD